MEMLEIVHEYFGVELDGGHIGRVFLDMDGEYWLEVCLDDP
jgi:hypothetical protein